VGAAAPNAKRDKAADTGTGLHDDLEHFLKTGKLPDRERTDEDKLAFANFMGFWSSSRLRLVASEVCVAVPPAGLVVPPDSFTSGWAEATGANPWPCAPYGGKFDVLLADEQDRLILGDFKTGSAVDRKTGIPFPDVWIQVAGAYKTALECQFPGVKIHNVAMLHVRHDVPSDKVLHWCPSMERAQAAWTRIRGVYDDLRVLEGKE
jgi:hypothetical protein